MPVLFNNLTVSGPTKTRKIPGGSFPALELDFKSSSSLDSFTFTRASTGTYVDGSGVVQIASTNEARFDHDLVTGEQLGLLIEEERTNVNIRSEEIDHGGWFKSQVNGAPAPTITGNFGVAPDGTTTATRIQMDVTTATHELRVGQTVTGPFANPHDQNFSIYMKTNDGSTKTVAIVSDVTLRVKTVTGTWQRFDVTQLASAGTPAGCQFRIRASDEAVVHDLLVWGGQQEINATASSYIPTTTVTVTRSADTATTTDMSWYNDGGPGTMFTEFVVGEVSSNVVIDISSAVNTRININQSATNAASMFVQDGGVTQTTQQGPGGAPSIGDVVKAAAAWDIDDFRAAVDGSLTAGDNSGTAPSSLTNLNLGTLIDGTLPLNGHITQFIYWPKRLSDSELNTLTT